MGRKRYTEALKIEAVRQVTEADHGGYDVASRLGICNKCLYDWIKAYGPESVERFRPQERIRKNVGS